MTLRFSEADVERLLDMPAAIAVVEEAFRRLSVGEAENSPRVRVKAPGIVLHSMSAAAAYLGYVGWKQYTTTPSGAKFLVGLHRQSDGELVALIEANRLGQLRTGAVTGVAAAYLAAMEADRAGLFGTGWQAQSQLQAISIVRPLRRVLVYSRDADRRRRFADQMTGKLGIQVEPADDPQQCVRDMPLVVTATSSSQPVFAGQWLSDGCLVCAIGSNWLHKAEIDVATVRRAGRIVCDSIECCRREAGDFVAALEQGVFTWDQAIELASVVGESRGQGPPTAPARIAHSGITLFKSVGMAIEDVAVAARIVERANRP
jgi:ornithine cyclodeaminase/alanine dehydrogenase-like protein (mu-crystallin family)